jgi:hypothetical protein
MQAKTLRIVGVLLLVLCPAAIFSQTTSSTLSGTLVDQSDAVLPGVTLTLTEQSTGAARTAVSSDTGLFRFLELRPGLYSLRVETKGFKTHEMRDISLASSETRDLGRVAMQIGGVAEVVTVTAAATAVQTTSAERSALIDTHQLTEIALRGRDPYDYMRLLPGIVDQTANRDLASGYSMSGLTINGMSSGSKNVTLDGMNSVDQQQGNSTFVTPSLDAIGEIRVIANGYQAEFGRNAGGTINIITRSGTRDFHGTYYWNHRHESMNANSFFNNRSGIDRPIYRYRIMGYTIGGPVTIPGVFNKNRDKLFFFWSQEYTAIKMSAMTVTANMPTAAERSGDFSNSRDSKGNLILIKDPNLPGVPCTTADKSGCFPDNKIPTNRINSLGLALLNQFPLPNGYVNPAAGQQYMANYKATEVPFHNRRDDILKVDYNLTSKISVNFRYGHDFDETGQPFYTGQAGGNVVNGLPGWLYTGHLTHTISPSMVNEVTFGWGRNQWLFYVPGGDDSKYFRTTALNPPTLSPLPTGDQYLPYLPQVTFAGGSLVNTPTFSPGAADDKGATCKIDTGTCGVPRQAAILGKGAYWTNFNKIWSGSDDFSKMLGSHSIKTGVYIEKNLKNHDAGAGYNGYYNFGSNTDNPFDTNNGFANALLGIYQSYNQSTNLVHNLGSSWTVEGYIQDNWRVNSKFTLDVGVRWSHMGPLSDNDNSKAFSEFTPSLWDASKVVRLYYPAVVGGKNVALDKATGNTAPYALVSTIVPNSGNVVNGMKIIDGQIYDLPFLAFAPRVGFAWNVTGDGKTAIRGGFGVFYNRPTANDMNTRAAPPTTFLPIIYYGTFDQVTQAATSAAYSPMTVGGPAAEMKLQRAYQGNFTIQRDIGFGTVIDVAYVGNFDRHAPEARDNNPIPIYAYGNPANLFLGRAINANLLRYKYPGMGTVNLYSGSRSDLNYNALQIQARRRMTKGLQFALSYTLSKALGTVGYDPYTVQRDWWYAPLGYDRTHALAINYAYQLPKAGPRVGFLKYVINDWTFSGITTFMTGFPVTPTCTSTSAGINNSDPSWTGLTATGATPALRCKQVADPNDFQQTFYTNFNTKAFALADPGTFGTIGLNRLRQPSFSNWDMTLMKKIPLGKSETRAIRIRIEAYNIFNHTEFQAIGTTYSFSGTTNTNTQTGQYTSTYSPRLMSLTMRIDF